MQVLVCIPGDSDFVGPESSLRLAFFILIYMVWRPFFVLDLQSFIHIIFLAWNCLNFNTVSHNTMEDDFLVMLLASNICSSLREA